MVENTNLLDRINEGLIVVPQDEPNPTFTNKSAMRIFARPPQASKLQDHDLEEQALESKSKKSKT